MTAHEIDNMASLSPESLSEDQISEINEKAISINTEKATEFGSVFSKVRFIFIFFFKKTHIIVRLNFTRSRNCNANSKQLSTSEFVYEFQNTA